MVEAACTIGLESRQDLGPRASGVSASDSQKKIRFRVIGIMVEVGIQCS